MTTTAVNVKYCQSCIERGFNPPNPASREWQAGIFYCDDCFMAIINNLTNIAPASVIHVESTTKVEQGPLLPVIYQALNIPIELQFDNVDTTCRNYDKIFNYHAPAIINRTLESITEEIEQLGMSIFQIKYKLDPLQREQARLKEERRKEKGLKDFDDSKEEYAKVKKPSSVKTTQEEKMAKTLGMSLEAYKAFIKTTQDAEKIAREKKFNILAGNCGECGGPMPCIKHG